jgi:hypothetical protein
MNEQAGLDPKPREKLRVFTGSLYRTQNNRTGPVIFIENKPDTPPPKPTRKRPLRIAQMLALAHKAQELVDRQYVQSRAELARRIGFTRARISQLLDLTLLAPAIQEEILFAEASSGREGINEHALRELVQAADWEEQRRIWQEIRGDECQ